MDEEPGDILTIEELSAHLNIQTALWLEEMQGDKKTEKISNVGVFD